MTLMRDGVIALLAAVGLTAILWSLAEMIFRRRERDVQAVLLLPLRESVSEYEVQTLLAQRRRLDAEAGIVLLDCGLDELERRRAELFTERYEGVTLLRADEVAAYWKEN